MTETWADISDLFYNFIWSIGTPIFIGSGKPLVLHLDRARREGAFILASNHHSPYDVPLLIRHTPRHLDFVSIVEVFRHPFVAWFYGSMNAFPLDRSKPDGPTVRVILDRLRRGRAIAMFPEGGFRKFEDSVINGGRMRPGVGRIAQMTGAPVIPCVVLHSEQYKRVSAWLPLRRIRYGLIYGEPIPVDTTLDKAEAATQLEEKLRAAFVSLYQELAGAMGETRTVL